MSETRVTRLFIDRFTVLDVAVLDATHGFRGESYFVSAVLEGEVDAHGFIFDFGAAKRVLKELVDTRMDHRLLVPRGLGALRTDGARTQLVLRDATPLALSYDAPNEAFVALELDDGAPPKLAQELERWAAPLLPANVRRLSLVLEPDPDAQQRATFRYTHGLKHHDGNCQRLLHGHHGSVEVRRDDTAEPALEFALVDAFRDAHFASHEDVDPETLRVLGLGRRDLHATGATRLAYRSAQGDYAATLPRSRLIVLDGPPSIESIARLAHHLATRASPPGSDIEVRVWEGLHKGASVATR